MYREQTFIAVKPEGVQRHLIGEIITRFEKRGLKLMLNLIMATGIRYSSISLLRKPRLWAWTRCG